MELIAALLLTVVTEGLALLLLTRSREWVLWSVYCNLITNPLLNLTLRLFRPLPGFRYPIVLAVLEGIVILSEAAMYRGMSRQSVGRCLLCSCLANAASVLIGILVF